MTDYWISGAKYWCEDCRKFITDNKVSRKHHETGPAHIANRQARITNLTKNNQSTKNEYDDVSREISRLRYEAEGALTKDYDAAQKGRFIRTEISHREPTLHRMPEMKYFDSEMIEMQRKVHAALAKKKKYQETLKSLKEMPAPAPQPAPPPQEIIPAEEEVPTGEEQYDPANINIESAEEKKKREEEEFETAFTTFNWTESVEWNRYRRYVTIPPTEEAKRILEGLKRKWLRSHLAAQKAKEEAEAEEIRQQKIQVIVRQQERRRKQEEAATRDTAGVIGRWEEVVDTSSTYSDFYRPSAPKEESVSIGDIALNVEEKPKPTKLKREREPQAPILPPKPQGGKKKNDDDSDSDDVISDTTIVSLGGASVGKEKLPDNFQMERLNRLNGGTGDNPPAFKKRKIVSTNTRKKTTSDLL